MKIAALVFDKLTLLDIVGPAEVAQLCIEYDPQPLFDAGAPSKASAAVLEAARGTLTTVVRDALGYD